MSTNWSTSSQSAWSTARSSMWPSYSVDLVDEELERLGAGALLAALGDCAVDDLDDRLDRQRRGEHRLGAADAAALLEVVERVERAEHLRPRGEIGGEVGDLVERAAGGGPAGAGEGDRADAEADAAAVDDADGHRASATARAASSALCIVADRAPDSDDDDDPGGAFGVQLAVDDLELARCRGCRLGQRGAARARAQNSAVGELARDRGTPRHRTGS